MDYLTESNRFTSGEAAATRISAKGKTVLVIGGGDTGADCVGTANRQGAKKVYQYEILPKPGVWSESWNPSWPDWPSILRTSSSHDEGCERDWSILTKKFSGSGSRLEQGHFVRVDWKKDANGQNKMTEIPGSEFSMKVDLVLLAMGFLHVHHSRLLEDLGIDFDNRGNVKLHNYQTTVPGVYAAGDSGTGASLVVRAIFHGREAAKSIDTQFKS